MAGYGNCERFRNTNDIESSFFIDQFTFLLSQSAPKKIPLTSSQTDKHGVMMQGRNLGEIVSVLITSSHATLSFRVLRVYC